MTQLFTNNADSALTASINASDTSCTVADGSRFAAPTGGDYQLVTINTGTTYEICRLTARTGNTLTITRAQEGTTAQIWAAGSRVFADVTAAQISAAVPDDGFVSVQSLALGATALGANATNIQPARLTASDVASGEKAVCIGNRTSAAGVSALAIGDGGTADGNNSVVIGSFGPFGSAEGSIAINGVSVYPYALNVGALPAALSSDWQWGNADAFAGNSTMASVVLSAPIDVKTLGTITCPLQAGVTFYADEVGLIVDGASTVTGQPEISFGITGNNTKLLASTATTGLTAAKMRQRFAALLSADGETSYTVTVDVAATGTTFDVRAYWKGFAVQDVEV